MSSLIAKLMGSGISSVVVEDEEEQTLIPDDAQRITVDDEEAEERKRQRKKSDYLPTSLALVAPDCTPEAEAPLSPSLVPAPPQPAPVAQLDILPPEPPKEAVDDVALQTVLGNKIPGIPSPGEFAAGEAGGMGVGEALVPGSPMPEHKPGNLSERMPGIRKFLRING